MSIKILFDTKSLRKITGIGKHTKIIDESPQVKIKEKDFSSSLKPIEQNVKIKHKQESVKIIENLPFRVRFTNVLIPGELGVPPIGIAVIGFNNYIL